MTVQDDDLDEAVRLLEERGWFSQRSKEVRLRLRATAKLRLFEAGERIYLAGDRPNGVFGLVHGSIDISFPRSDGEDYVMHRAGAGFWIGDLAVLSGGVRLVSIRAAEPTSMIQLPAQDLNRLISDDPLLYADFYALTYENFQTAFKVITNLSLPSPDKRVADRLLLEAAAWSDPDGWITISQPELAQLVAVSLPTVQRVVTRFVDAGLVEKGYGRIKLIDRAALKRVCLECSD